MRRRGSSGCASCQSHACCRARPKTTFGRWATLARVARAPRSTTTASVGATRRRSSTMTIPTCLRSGTSSSCNSTASRAAICDRFLRSTWTPGWASSGSCQCFRTSARTTTPTSSCRSSRRFRNSRALRLTPASWATRIRSSRTLRTASSPTTFARSASPSPTARSPPTRGAATCSGASCGAPSATVGRCSARRRASSPRSCPPSRPASVTPSRSCALSWARCRRSSPRKRWLSHQRCRAASRSFRRTPPR